MCAKDMVRACKLVEMVNIGKDNLKNIDEYKVYGLQSKKSINNIKFSIIIIKLQDNIELMDYRPIYIEKHKVYGYTKDIRVCLKNHSRHPCAPLCGSTMEGSLCFCREQNI